MGVGFVTLVVVIASILGFLIGVSIGKSRRSNSKSKGLIYVDLGDSDNNPSLFLEATSPIVDITSQKKVVFDVVVISNNSRK